MSSQRQIQEKLQGVIQQYTQNPDKALSQDKEAIAVVEEGLRVRATGPDGQTLVCDMPTGLGGGASAPTPGWMLRAALANCEAVMIALRAAQVGIALRELAVRVDSLSDDRGMLGMDDSKPAGPMNIKVSVRIGAEGTSSETLRAIVEWAKQHSPVVDPLERKMPVEHEVEVV